MRLALSALAIAAGLLACGPQGGTSCPNDLPRCSASPPTYAQVAPIFQAKCASCHSAGGSAPDRRFDTYDEIAVQRSATLDQIYSCKMPPPGYAPLSDAERQLALGWLVCNSLPR